MMNGAKQSELNDSDRKDITVMSGVVSYLALTAPITLLLSISSLGGFAWLWIATLSIAGFLFFGLRSYRGSWVQWLLFLLSLVTWALVINMIGSHFGSGMC